MVTVNVLLRTFNLMYNNSTGTCFTLDINGKQYFITARHVVEGLKDGEYILISQNGQWMKSMATLIGHSQTSDVTVFSLTAHLGANPLPANISGLMLAQEVYFLGFPYGLRTNVGEIAHNFPMPFVKRAIVSGFETENNLQRFYLDGINNPGFSGGPIVFKNPTTNQFEVCGIISGYRIDYADTIMDGKTTPIQVQANSGLIIAYSIKVAKDLIDANPNGRIIR